MGTAQRELGGQREGEGRERKKEPFSLPFYLYFFHPLSNLCHFPQSERLEVLNCPYLASLPYLALRLASVQAFRLTVRAFLTNCFGD